MVCQKSVGNEAVYTETAYKALCTVVGIVWNTSTNVSSPLKRFQSLSVHDNEDDGLVQSTRLPTPDTKRSGITVDGLLALYRHMGLECLVKDMKTLKISPVKAQEQLESLRRTARHLTKLEAKVKVYRGNSIIRNETYRVL